MTQVHILNGDSLKRKFPKAIAGEIIIMRECLIDGNVQGESLTEFFLNRAHFLEGFEEVAKGKYFEVSAPELTKIAELGKQKASDKAIYCWFEEDLFCQVNFWFVVSLLAKQVNHQQVYFVRPKIGCEYSFANMNSDELTSAFNQCVLIPADELKILAKFWPCYQQHKYSELIELCRLLPLQWQFLLLAIQAQIDRIPDENGFGRPQRSLINIMKELNCREFGPVFREFSKREAIYSFGDMQVKRMFDGLSKNS